MFLRSATERQKVNSRNADEVFTEDGGAETAPSRRRRLEAPRVDSIRGPLASSAR